MNIGNLISNQTTITRIRRPGIDWASAERYAREHGIALVDEPMPSQTMAFCKRLCLGNATDRASGRE